MTESVLREPEQIRQDCARKLAPIEASGMFTAILGCLLGEDWATLDRLKGEAGFNYIIGDEEDLIRNVHGIAKTAGLDGDELGYLLAAIAKIKRVE